MAMRILYHGKAGAAALADLVFVHGFGGDLLGTWTDVQSSTCWPRDLLKYDFDEVRIFSWGYDAGVFSQSQAGLFGHAETLLSDLSSFRKTASEKTRPIVWICHSLGGLVVKEAMIRASHLLNFNDRPELGCLYLHTKGIIFMATPHRGTETKALQIAEIAQHAAKVTWKSPNKDVLRNLKSNAAALNQQRKSFTTIMQKFTMSCLYEEYPTKGSVIVPEYSACFDAFGLRTDMLPGDHRTMCKFARRDDVGYQRVMIHIQHIMESITPKSEGIQMVGTGSIYTGHALQPALNSPSEQRFLEAGQSNSSHLALPSPETDYPLVIRGGGRVEIIQAQTQFQALPPLPKDPFLGREALLRKLFHWLNAGDRKRSSVRLCILNGIAGVGKSSVAKNFVHKHEKDFDSIFWVSKCFSVYHPSSAMEASGCQCNLQSLHDSLRLEENNWLLVFDDVRTAADTLSFVPTSTMGFGSVIITTQNSRAEIPLARELLSIHVDPLDPTTGAELVSNILERYQTSMDNNIWKDATDLSKLFGGLPEFVIGAARIIARQEYILSEFVEEFSSFGEAWIDDSPNRLEICHAALLTIFDFALEQLTTDARTALEIISFLDCSSIPEQFFQHIEREIDGSQVGDNQRRRSAANSIQRKTQEYNLVSAQGASSYVLNSSVQYSLQRKLLKDLKVQENSFVRAFCMVRSIVEQVGPESDCYQQPGIAPDLASPRVEKHLISLFKANNAFAFRQKLDFAGLFYDEAFILWERGEAPASGIQLLNIAKEILGDVAHDKLEEKAYIEVLLGRFYTELGFSMKSTAEAHFRKALQIRTTLNNSTSVDDFTRAHSILRLASLADVAWCDLENGNLPQASALFSECLSHHVEWDDGEREVPYNWAQVCFGMSYHHLLTNDKVKALRFARNGSKALRTRNLLREEVVESEDFLSACILAQCGRHKEALQVFDQLYKSRRARYGEANVRTIQSQYARAFLENKMGLTQDAESKLAAAVSVIPANREWPAETVLRIRLLLYRIQKSYQSEPSELWPALQTEIGAVLGVKQTAYELRIDEYLEQLDSLHHISQGRFETPRIGKIESFSL